MTTLFTQDSICTFTLERLEQLKQLAASAPLQRARFCMHLSHDDAIQEMVIALTKKTYIRPHRHPNKTESVHIIEGDLIIVFFDDLGKVEKQIYLSANNKDIPFLYRLSTPFWHSVTTLSPFAIFHEVITGSFSPCDYPTWEPKDDKAIEHFQKQLLINHR